MKGFGKMAIDFLEDKYKVGEVFHDAINKVLIAKTLGKDIHIPHEWYFIKVLISKVLEDNNIANLFSLYVFQYYPDYDWIGFTPMDTLWSVILECRFHDYQFQKKYELGITEEIDILPRSMNFGEIATDFLIRFLGYSLIKSSNQNIILTSQNDCHKRFEKLLYDGYSLEKRKKVIYQNGFKKVPVLPTRQLDFEIEEIIETSDDKYERVLKPNNR